MKRLVALLLCLCAFAAPAQLAKTIPAPTGYVDDYAHVLSPDGSAQIETLCKQIHDQTRAQVFLVTIADLKGDSIEQFSNDLFHQWKIGEKGTDRGVLVVFATGDHMHRIEVGYGFEGVLNDAKAGDIGRAITPELHARNYTAAGLAAVTQLSAIITPGAVLDPTAAPPTPLDDAALAAASRRANWVVFFIFAFVVGFFVLLITLMIRRGPRSRGIYSSGGDSGSSSFFSGSSSSDSSSDSGSDFGGGDGGDSGGGGASGSD